MNIETILNKKYSFPNNISNTTAHKYLEVINKDYAKYLEILYWCDGFCMYKQFYDIVALIDGKHRTPKSNQVIGNSIINKLLDLGFIAAQNINTNKFFYLKRPAIALVEGDYVINKKIILSKDLKNDKFKTAILKVQYFIKNKKFLIYSNYFNQLKLITSKFYNIARESGNKFNYSLAALDAILGFESMDDILNYLDINKEYKCNLGIIRSIWSGLGCHFRKMQLKRQLISNTPTYYQLFVKQSTGEIILHYIPNIIIFDINHDYNFYKTKLTNLFNIFYNLDGNELINSQSSYFASGKTSIGSNNVHHIGYSITLIGTDSEVLNSKKKCIDSEVGINTNSPLMDYCNIECLEIDNYFSHSSQKQSSFTKKQNELIDRMIFKKLNELTATTTVSNDNDTNNAGHKILELIKK